jgi:GGDEF domain-containing protein
MNRKVIVAFSIVCIVATMGAVISVAYRVIASDAAGRNAAKADFEGLRSVLAYVKSPSDLADPGLRARLAARYEASSALLLVDVYERDLGDRWRIPSDSPYLPPGSGASPSPVHPPASTILLSAPLKGDSSGRLAVDALYTSLSQVEAFEPFRDALICLGAFLALAAVTLAIISGGEGMRAVKAEAETKGAEPSVAPSDFAAEAAHYQYETLAAEAERNQAAREEEFDIPLMDYGLAIKTPPKDLSVNEADPKEEAPTAAEAGEPAGLYSPASGLGWESYTLERLNAEISRSASFEQDLSLLVCSYDGLTSQDAAYRSIGEAIKGFFSFRDLAFERGDDGFSVILPNIDSSHAIRMAEEFFKKLVFLADGDYAELELLPLYMGISSRAGRLVDADRLTTEASSALEKARYEKDSHIVAFKPDPDKYRLYLASKGA